MTLTIERIEEFRELARTGKGEVNLSAADMRGLCDLAIIGLAVTPRPISEAKKEYGKDEFLIRYYEGTIVAQGIGCWRRPISQRDGYRVNEGKECWLQSDWMHLFPEPTHFIPLSALPQVKP